MGARGNARWRREVGRSPFPAARPLAFSVGPFFLLWLGWNSGHDPCTHAESGGWWSRDGRWYQGAPLSLFRWPGGGTTWRSLFAVESLKIEVSSSWISVFLFWNTTTVQYWQVANCPVEGRLKMETMLAIHQPPLRCCPDRLICSIQVVQNFSGRMFSGWIQKTCACTHQSWLVNLSPNRWFPSL